MNVSTDRKALLKEEADSYIAQMEASGTGVNYNNVTTDRLLILEALNDWSGRLLAEGGDLKLTSTGVNKGSLRRIVENLLSFCSVQGFD